MTPSTLLHLWRDRWHLPQHPEHSVPLVHGRISRWTMDMARSDHWGIPGLVTGVLFAALALLFLAVGTRLSTNSQIVLAWSLVFFAIYLRRHRGQVVALAIVCMAVLLGLRYFYWRVDSSLPSWGTGNVLIAVVFLSVELLLWVRTGLDYFASVWPVETDTNPLPDDAVGWPTVDVVYLSNDSDLESTIAFVERMPDLDWPQNKYRVFLIASADDERLRAACEAKQVACLVYYQCAPNDLAAKLNRFLYESDSELLACSDSSQYLPTDFLRQTVGWFVQEPHLGLVQTPRFPLATPARRDVESYLMNLEHQPECALFRRSHVQDVGGFALMGLPFSPSTESELDAAGIFTAYLLVRTTDGAAKTYSRLDGPYKYHSLPLRIQINSVREFLHFYSPVFTATFWLIPIAVLGFGATPIVADPATLAAYWLPHWILGRLALATALEHHRLRWWDFVKEELGGIAVLTRTAGSFLATRIQRLAWTKKREPFRGLDRLPQSVVVTQRPWLVAGIAVFGLVALWGVNGLRAGHPPLLAPMYIAWCVLLMLGLLAELAVQRELDWVQAHHNAAVRIPCMVRLMNDGRALRATTNNFPQQPLELTLVAAITLQNPQAAQISLFMGTREFIFPCVLTGTQAHQAIADIPAKHRREIHGLSAMVFSRPSQWPKWLPASHADRLLPRWLERILLRLQDAFYNLAVKSTLPAVMQKIRDRIFPGSSTNG